MCPVGDNTETESTRGHFCTPGFESGILFLVVAGPAVKTADKIVYLKKYFTKWNKVK